MTKAKNVLRFMDEDRPRTLFPMMTSEVVCHMRHERLAELAGDAFVQQQRAYASKRGGHLRRTVKLDPVADWFLYSLVYEHRALFKAKRSRIRSFGYGFKKGKPIPGSESYGEFRTAVRESSRAFKHGLSFDVSQYFNSIYHHDLVAWFEAVGAPLEAVNTLGRFLRESAGGRSVDCLPQGIYPAKVIGSAFLGWLIDDNIGLKAARHLRFMDDIYIFDDDAQTLRDDFERIQRLIGEHGLGVNAGKTRWHQRGVDIGVDENAVLADLLQMRRHAVIASGGELDDDDDELGEELSDEQEEYLLDLLDDSIEEEDAELVLTLMDDHYVDVMEHLPDILEQFPNLAQRVYRFCGRVPDKDAVGEMVVEYLHRDHVEEYLLFWFAAMLDHYVRSTPSAEEAFRLLLERTARLPLARARLLEVPEERFGMPQVRQEAFKGGAGWEAWAAAVGSRDEPKGSLHQRLKYFRKQSPINAVVGEAVERFNKQGT